MIDDQEVIRAKAVLRNAGYYCVPREKMVSIEAQCFISHRAMARYGSDSGYIKHVLKDLHVCIGVEMMNAQVLSFTNVNQEGPSGESGTTYRLRADVTPHQLITDPLLDFMRMKQE